MLGLHRLPHSLLLLTEEPGVGDLDGALRWLVEPALDHDMGAWEVLAAAVAAGVGPPGLTRRHLDAHVVSGLEEHGPVGGLARDAFAPGLLAGVGGMAYQLLRMHPGCDLPSMLLQG